MNDTLTHNGHDFELDELTWTTDEGGVERASIQLRVRDSAPNPASTRHRLYGPGTVRYARYPDGGLIASTASASTATGQHVKEEDPPPVAA